MASSAKVNLKVKTAKNAAALLSVNLPAGKLSLRVGFLGDGTAKRDEDDGITNPQLAAVHEFGYPEGNIPERPFMGPSFDKQREKYREQMRALILRAGSDAAAMERGLGRIGVGMVSDIRDFIVGGASVGRDNSDEVKRRKAKNSSGTKWGIRTLVDTGQMVRSISWVVVQG